MHLNSILQSVSVDVVVYCIRWPKPNERINAAMMEIRQTACRARGQASFGDDGYHAGRSAATISSWSELYAASDRRQLRLDTSSRGQRATTRSTLHADVVPKVLLGPCNNDQRVSRHAGTDLVRHVIQRSRKLEDRSAGTGHGTGRVESSTHRV